ncbi:hypothetical protein [Paenibacillus flagellatus]|nr:hypothetical protein [Paenibacillus flagellatus]
MLTTYSTPIIIGIVILGVLGFAYSIRLEMQYRKKMRQEREEIRNIKRF